MSLKVRALVLFLMTLGLCSSRYVQASDLADMVTHGEISGDLANALAKFAWESKVPVIAELAQPLPKIQVAAGTHSVQYLLRELERQAPGYRFELNGKAVHFYNQALKRAKFNFLGLRFPRYLMPPNLSELKLTFPGLAIGLLSGRASGGYTIFGFGDAEFAKERLRKTTLENITGREILLRVANEAPTFFSIVVFPDTHPTKKQAEYVGMNWFWQSFREPMKPLYVQPAPIQASQSWTRK
jgi:hypothetical protein